MTQLSKVSRSPESIFEYESWDNLIILDACRHDVYEKVKGEEVEYRITKGSSSPEFVKENFSEMNYEDIVYVNSNGFLTDKMLEKLVGRSAIFFEKYDTVETD